MGPDLPEEEHSELQAYDEPTRFPLLSFWGSISPLSIGKLCLLDLGISDFLVLLSPLFKYLTLPPLIQMCNSDPKLFRRPDTRLMSTILEQDANIPGGTYICTNSFIGTCRALDLEVLRHKIRTRLVIAAWL